MSIGNKDSKIVFIRTRRISSILMINNIFDFFIQSRHLTLNHLEILSKKVVRILLCINNYKRGRQTLNNTCRIAL